MANEFERGNDITTPEGLAAEAASLAEGMRQQAVASQQGSPWAGHPHPAFFYNKVADVLAASAAFIKSMVAPVPAAPEPEKKVEEDKTKKAK